MVKNSIEPPYYTSFTLGEPTKDDWVHHPMVALLVSEIREEIQDESLIFRCYLSAYLDDEGVRNYNHNFEIEGTENVIEIESDGSRNEIEFVLLAKSKLIELIKYLNR